MTARREFVLDRAHARVAGARVGDFFFYDGGSVVPCFQASGEGFATLESCNEAREGYVGRENTADMRKAFVIGAGAVVAGLFGYFLGGGSIAIALGSAILGAYPVAIVIELTLFGWHP